MAKPLVSDALWERVQAVLPVEPPKPKGGRPRVPDRAALTGIVFVLKTGLPWEELPRELGCGSGMTCWRRLRDWQAAGVWRAVWHTLLQDLDAQGQLTTVGLVLDSSSTRALFGGRRPARIPPTAARPAANAI